MARALAIGPVEKADIARAIELARRNPMPRELCEALRHLTPSNGRLTLDMRREQLPKRTVPQTVLIPFGFRCNLTFEDQPEAGLCRHLSISIDDNTNDPPGTIRVPHPLAVQMIANEFGLPGPFVEYAHFWQEEYEPGKYAINLVWKDADCG
jgi:hypothetical protein